jgi:hypothetical protein
MSYVKNKYKLPITRNLLGRYIDLIINALFKTLPTFEGLSINKEIIYTSEQSYIHYQQHLEKLIIEITGDYYIFCENPYILKLLGLVQGMQDIKINEHDIVKSMVFECIKICENIKKQLDNDNLK